MLLGLTHSWLGRLGYKLRLPERCRPARVPIIPADQPYTFNNPEIACFLEYTADCSKIVRLHIRRSFEFS